MTGLPFVVNAAFAAGAGETLPVMVSPSASSVAIAAAYGSRGNPRIGAASGILPGGSATITATPTASAITWSGLSGDYDALLETLTGNFNQAAGVMLWQEAAPVDPTVVTPTNAAHSQIATAPTATPNSTIEPVEASHSHGATQPTIGAKSAVSPDPASHAHLTSEPDVAASSAIVPEGASHGHSCTSASISAGGAVAPNSVAHAHAAGWPAFSVRYSFVVGNAGHQHSATSPWVADSSGEAPVVKVRFLTFTVEPKTLSFEAEAKPLTFVVDADGARRVKNMPNKIVSEVWICPLDLTPWLSDGRAVTTLRHEPVTGGVEVDQVSLAGADTGTFRVAGGAKKRTAQFDIVGDLSDGNTFGQRFQVTCI